LDDVEKNFNEIFKLEKFFEQNLSDEPNLNSYSFGIFLIKLFFDEYPDIQNIYGITKDKG